MAAFKTGPSNYRIGSAAPLFCHPPPVARLDRVEARTGECVRGVHLQGLLGGAYGDGDVALLANVRGRKLTSNPYASGLIVRNFLCHGRSQDGQLFAYDVSFEDAPFRRAKTDLDPDLQVDEGQEFPSPMLGAEQWQLLGHPGLPNVDNGKGVCPVCFWTSAARICNVCGRDPFAKRLRNVNNSSMWALPSKERNRRMHALNGNARVANKPLLLSDLDIDVLQAIASRLPRTFRMAFKLVCLSFRKALRDQRTCTSVVAAAEGSRAFFMFVAQIAAKHAPCPLLTSMCLRLAAVGRVAEIEILRHLGTRWDALSTRKEHIVQRLWSNECTRAAAVESQWYVLEWALQQGYLHLNRVGERELRELDHLLIGRELNHAMDDDDKLQTRIQRHLCDAPTLVKLVWSPLVWPTIGYNLNPLEFMVLNTFRALPPVGCGVLGYSRQTVINFFFALGCHIALSGKLWMAPASKLRECPTAEKVSDLLSDLVDVGCIVDAEGTVPGREGAARWLRHYEPAYPSFLSYRGVLFSEPRNRALLMYLPEDALCKILFWVHIADRLACQLTCQRFRRLLLSQNMACIGSIMAAANGSFSYLQFALLQVQCPPRTLCVELAAIGDVPRLAYVLKRGGVWTYECGISAARNSQWYVLEWALSEGHEQLSDMGQKLLNALASRGFYHPRFSTLRQLVHAPLDFLDDDGFGWCFARVQQVLRAMPRLPRLRPFRDSPRNAYSRKNILAYFRALGCDDVMLGGDEDNVSRAVSGALHDLNLYGYITDVQGQSGPITPDDPYPTETARNRYFSHGSAGSFFALRDDHPDHPSTSIGFPMASVADEQSMDDEDRWDLAPPSAPPSPPSSSVPSPVASPASPPPMRPPSSPPVISRAVRVCRQVPSPVASPASPPPMPPPSSPPVMSRAVRVRRRRPQPSWTVSAARMLLASLCWPLRSGDAGAPPFCATLRTPPTVWALSPKERNRLMHICNGNVSVVPAPLLLSELDGDALRAIGEFGTLCDDGQLAFSLTCKAVAAAFHQAIPKLSSVAAVATHGFSYVCWALDEAHCPAAALCLRLAARGRVLELEYVASRRSNGWSSACITAAAQSGEWSVLEHALERGYERLSRASERLLEVLEQTTTLSHESRVKQLVRSQVVALSDPDGGMENGSGVEFLLVRRRSLRQMVLQAVRVLPHYSLVSPPHYEREDLISLFFALGCDREYALSHMDSRASWLAVVSRESVGQALDELEHMGYLEISQFMDDSNSKSCTIHR